MNLLDLVVEIAGEHLGEFYVDLLNFFDSSS